MKSATVFLTLAAPVAAVGFAIAQRASAPAAPQAVVQSAADVIAGPDEQFTTLPGFKVERVVPEANRESLILITFDAEGAAVGEPGERRASRRPSQELVDKDGDGIYESSRSSSRMPR